MNPDFEGSVFGSPLYSEVYRFKVNSFGMFLDFGCIQIPTVLTLKIFSYEKILAILSKLAYLDFVSFFRIFLRLESFSHDPVHGSQTLQGPWTFVTSASKK